MKWLAFVCFLYSHLLVNPHPFFFGNLNYKNEFFRNERWIESTLVGGVGVVCSLFNKIKSTKWLPLIYLNYDRQVLISDWMANPRFVYQYFGFNKYHCKQDSSHKSWWQCWVWLTKIHAWACLDLKQHLISAKTWWAWSYHDFWLCHLAISNRILRNNSLDVGTEVSKRAWRGTAVRDTSFLTMIQQSYGIVYVRSISHL